MAISKIVFFNSPVGILNDKNFEKKFNQAQMSKNEWKFPKK